MRALTCLNWARERMAGWPVANESVGSGRNSSIAVGQWGAGGRLSFTLAETRFAQAWRERCFPGRRILGV